jgi:hypothetical protein
MSYFYKKYYNIDKLFSPYFLAYYQFLHTQNLNSIDLYTGIKVSTKIGVCADYLVNEDSILLDICSDYTNYYTNNINSYIIIDASQNKVDNYSKIKLNTDNIQKCLNDEIPILCSFKIIPINESNNTSNNFFDYLNDPIYWSNVKQYYDKIKTSRNILKNIMHIYSVSIVITGYDNTKKQFKIRGCWGDKVGINGYFFIDYNIIETYNNLFFDGFILDTKPSLCNYNCIELCVHPFIEEKTKSLATLANCECNSSLEKISSKMNIYESLIFIETSENNSINLIIDANITSHKNSIKTIELL